MLTLEETKTLESYKKIAGRRNKTHADPNFWKPEFDVFKKLLPQGGQIIDIGCGAGRDALMFANSRFFNYVGIDLSDEMLAAARELVPRIHLLKMNMYDLEFPPGIFDGFWAAASLLHIPKKNVRTVLNQIKKVVKPGGTGFIALKKGDGERMVRGQSEDDERFFAFYQDGEFSEILESNGFKILQHQMVTPDHKLHKIRSEWLTYFVTVL